MLTTHIWQEYLDLAEEVRKNEYAKMLYRQRKESIERVFADAKEKHAMRYTHHRGLAAVTRWVRLKYAAMNLKKLANRSWKNSFFFYLLLPYTESYSKTPVFQTRKQGFFDGLDRDTERYPGFCTQMVREYPNPSSGGSDFYSTPKCFNAL